jgi:hypothetical protein
VDPDPHYFENLDPDPEPHFDPHQSDKLDPEPDPDTQICRWQAECKEYEPI